MNHLPGRQLSCWQGLCRLLFSLGSLALYFEMTDARNMELSKIANEIFNKYMEC